MRPSLLFLCHTFPYPPHQGVEIRTLNVLRLLSQQFETQVLCYHRFTSKAELEAALAALRTIAPTRAFAIPQVRRPARLLCDHARSLVTGRLYTEYLYQSAEFHAALAEVLSTGAVNIVHIDSLCDLVGILPILGELPVVATHHNVESQLLQRRASLEGGALRRWYLALQARRMERTERMWCGRVTLNIAVSESDRTTLQAIAPDGRFAVIPNGVDTDFFRPDPSVEQGLVFVGGATWFPNRDALEYFATSILPLVRSRVGDVRVSWVGRASDADRKLYRDRHGIDLTGYVEDIRPFVRDAACYVVPLRVGGGTRLKILDAWAMGKAVVSTSIGCEGLDVREGENILVRDAPEAFADGVASVLRDRTLRARIGSQARATTESVYGWHLIGKSLIPLYRELVQTPPG